MNVPNDPVDRIKFKKKIINRVCLDMIAEQTQTDLANKKADMTKHRESLCNLFTSLEAKFSAKTDEYKRIFVELRNNVDKETQRSIELLFADSDTLKKKLDIVESIRAYKKV